MSFKVKRVYEPIGADDGVRILVDRLWPRGLKREDIAIEAWLKELGPSNELRHWFGHEADKWDEFRRRYALELEASEALWQPLLAKARRRRVTLLFGTREIAHNNAVALKLFLDPKL